MRRRTRTNSFWQLRRDREGERRYPTRNRQTDRYFATCLKPAIPSDKFNKKSHLLPPLSGTWQIDAAGPATSRNSPVNSSKGDCTLVVTRINSNARHSRLSGRRRKLGLVVAVSVHAGDVPGGRRPLRPRGQPHLQIQVESLLQRIHFLDQ